MAGTYYGYAERNADSYVDWYEVGKYATDMIDETIKVRQEKKDALDKATRDSLKQISDTPIGANASARQAALEMANTVSKNLLIQEKLMKAGKLDPKDYLIYNQNALDSIDLAFNANKAYQENYQKIMDGVKSGDMSGLTLLNAAKAEKYGNWNNMGWQMSPDGNLMVGIKTEKDIDGQKVKTLSDITSVNAVNGLLLNTIPHNKLETQIKQWVDTLGEETKVALQKAGYNRQGYTLTTTDITSRKDLDPKTKQILFDFMSAEKQMISTFLGDATNQASILFDTKRTNDKGVAYTATDDPEEAKRDSSKILRIYNPQTGGYNFEISEAQRQEAERFSFNRMREKYTYKEKIDVGSQLQDQSAEWKTARADKEKKENDTANMLGKFWYGNSNEVQAASDYFKGFRDKDGELMFTDIQRTPTGVRVVMANGTETTIPFAGKTQADFIRSAGPLLAGQIDIEGALKRGSFKQGAQFNAVSTGGSRTIGLPEQYKDYLENNFDAKIISMTEEDAEEEIKKLAALGGFEVTQSDVGQDYLTISRPEIKIGKTTLPSVKQKFSFDEQEPATQQKVRDAIIKFLTTNASPVSLKQSLPGVTSGGASQDATQQRIGNY